MQEDLLSFVEGCEECRAAAGRVVERLSERLARRPHLRVPGEMARHVVSILTERLEARSGALLAEIERDDGSGAAHVFDFLAQYDIVREWVVRLASYAETDLAALPGYSELYQVDQRLWERLTEAPTDRIDAMSLVAREWKHRSGRSVRFPPPSG